MNRRMQQIAAGMLAWLLAAATSMLAVPEARAEAPAGQITWALHFTLAPTLFEPAETPGLITPFIVLYALHDALLKPMPGKSMAPSLAESWSASPNGLVYEFVLRKGVRFHSGEPVTAEDVKFSFERYRGIAAKLLKDRVAAIETPDASHVRFRLKQPWPDFMTFYGTRLEPRGRVDGLFREQAAELDPKKREATLHRVQQLIHDKVMYLPIWQLSLLQAHGPRIAESGLGLIADYPWSAPYEELKLKAK